MNTFNTTIFPKYSWLAIPFLFLLYSAPSAIDYLFYFPDEKYYTDAVLQMMDQGDYFTPYKADGTPRFYKPIVTYWVLMGSYKILGVSTFSSRLFFWLAGALITTVVYFMAKSLLRDKKTAILAAFITAANPLVLMSAGRSIPDILLVLFLTVSAWGFLKILLTERPSGIFYWMAYIGAALAFEVKGLPAAAFAGISIIYLLLNPWKTKKLRDIIHPAAILSAIAVAFSWFVIMYFKHGTEYLNSFFADQVGYRVSSKTAQVLTNTFLGIINLMAFTVPWVIIAVSKSQILKHFVTKGPDERKALLGFIALWVIVVIAMSGAVFKFYDRYILPVVPLVSLFFAVVIIQSETRFMRPALKIFLAFNALVLFINLLYGIFIDNGFIIIAGTITGIALFALIVCNRHIIRAMKLANAILLLWFNGHVLLYAMLMPHPAKQLTNTILNHQDSKKEPVYVYGNIRMASGIRVYSHHKLDVVSMDTLYILPDNKNHLLVFNKKEELMLDLKDYRLIKGSEEWKRVPAERFPGFLKPAVEKLKESGTVYYIAKPLEK